MTKKLILTRAAGPQDWRAFGKEFAIGSTIYQFNGHDYGCVRDDATYGNRETIACTENEDGSGPFFTVPCEWLRYYDTAEQPEPQYLSRESWEKIKNLPKSK